MCVPRVFPHPTFASTFATTFTSSTITISSSSTLTSSASSTTTSSECCSRCSPTARGSAGFVRERSANYFPTAALPAAPTAARAKSALSISFASSAATTYSAARRSRLRMAGRRPKTGTSARRHGGARARNTALRTTRRTVCPRHAAPSRRQGTPQERVPVRQATVEHVARAAGSAQAACGVLRARTSPNGASRRLDASTRMAPMSSRRHRLRCCRPRRLRQRQST